MSSNDMAVDVIRDHPMVADAWRRVGPAGDARLVEVRPLFDRWIPDSSDLVQGWNIVFDRSLASSDSTDPGFDTAGWVDSRDGEPIPYRDMREWVDLSVSKLRPIAHGRCLEIGCGTGMILSRVTQVCSNYVGTDISLEAVEKCRAIAKTARCPTEIRHQAASVWSGLSGPFDLIIINSVVQYFPEQAYLDHVLAEAEHRLAPRGTIFVGDVRNLATEDAYEVWRRSGKRPLRGMAKELLVDPQYFLQRWPDAALSLEPKSLSSPNEMSLFRYDVLTQPGNVRGLSTVPWTNWECIGSLIALRATLVERHGVSFGVAGVPMNEGTWRELGPQSVGRMAAGSHRALMSVAASDPSGSYDVAFVPAESQLRDVEFPQAATLPSRLTSDPRFDGDLARLSKTLLPDLKRWLAARVGMEASDTELVLVS